MGLCRQSQGWVAGPWGLQAPNNTRSTPKNLPACGPREGKWGDGENLWGESPQGYRVMGGGQPK